MTAARDETGTLTHRRTDPVDADLRIVADRHSPSELWTTIATSDRFSELLVDAVRKLLADVPHHQRVRTLLDAGVTAGDGGYARQIVGLNGPPESDAYTRALAVTQQFGTGEVTPFGHRLEFADLTAGPLPLFDAVDQAPTIAVRIGQEFRQRRREQRERICQLLSILSSSCTVAIVSTGLTVRWLAHEHGDDLPASFSEECKTGGRRHSAQAEQVAAALEQVDPDSRTVRVLRELASEPTETRSYHDLTSRFEVSDSRISQVLSELADAGLVDRYGSQQHRTIELLPAGSALLDALDEEIGRQQRLDELFSETRQRHQRTCESAPRGRGSPDSTGDAATATTTPYRTRYLDRSTHYATSAAATAGDITVIDTTARTSTDSQQTRFVSFDEDRDEAVVAVHGSTPLQYAVSLAVGLASPRLLDKALPGWRLDDLEEPPGLLRDARCCGAISEDAIDDPQTLRDNLVEWGTDIEEMTRKLKREEYDDRDRFCGEILRSAHGLAGTIAHLFDACGVDLVRELRIPSLTDGQLSSLARTVAVSTAIQSQYGVFASWRQLYESRENKRRTALTPDVDAEDPMGEVIGQLVVCGPAAERFGNHVEGMLSSPASLHEDAPEFAVSASIATPGREAYTAAVNRMLATKNIRATPEAVTMFQALAGDVWAVTEAIHWLQGEDNPRTIRLDEVRVALAALEPDRLLPDAPPSVSQILSALLRSSRPLSRPDLADRAGVSSRSISRHLDALIALDIVRETDDELRLSLPFDSERGDTVVPTAVDETLSAQDVVFELVLAMVSVGAAGRLGDPTDPLGKPFFGPTLDTGPLHRHLPRVNPYLRVALTLCNHRDRPSSVVEFGEDVEQTSLREASSAAVG